MSGFAIPDAARVLQHRFAVLVPSYRVPQDVPSLLRDVSERELLGLHAKLCEVFERHFSSVAAMVNTTLDILQQRTARRRHTRLAQEPRESRGARLP